MFLEKKSENPKHMLERSEAERDMKNKYVKKKSTIVKCKWMQPISKPLLPKIIPKKLDQFSYKQG